MVNFEDVIHVHVDDHIQELIGHHLFKKFKQKCQMMSLIKNYRTPNIA